MKKMSGNASTGEVLDDLYDYSKTLPPVILLDDDDDEDEEEERILHPTKLSKHPLSIQNSKELALGQGEEASKVANDDWLEPPPSTVARQRVPIVDDTLLQLRQQKQVLQEIFLTSKASMRNSELNAQLPPQAMSSVSRDGVGVGSAENPSSQPVNSGEMPSKRQKIKLKLQDHSGEHGYQAYVDDKLEKIFAHYAKNKAKRPLTDFVFRFDGDALDPSSCPQGLQLEDEDVLEVHIKGGGK